MSDEAVIALAAVGVSGIVGLGSALFAFLSHKAERDERYRIALYPRRLEAYQSAVKWLVSLQNVVHTSFPLEGERRDTFHKLFQDADDWWQDNCVYLDPAFAEEFRRLLIEVGASATFGGRLTNTTAVSYFNDAWRVLWNGMGWKHVDVSVTQGSLDQGVKHD